MREDELDPAASTQMFQAFVDREEPEESGNRVLWLAITAGLAGFVILVLALLLLGR